MKKWYSDSNNLFWNNKNRCSGSNRKTNAYYLI